MPVELVEESEYVHESVQFNAHIVLHTFHCGVRHQLSFYCSSFHTKLYIPIDGSIDNDVDYLHTKAQTLAMQISAIDVLLTQ